jgi:hypothetical protein
MELTQDSGDCGRILLGRESTETCPLPDSVQLSCGVAHDTGEVSGSHRTRGVRGDEDQGEALE